MSARILASDLTREAGREVRLGGWVHRIRDFGGIRFLVLRDRSGLAQVLLPKGMHTPDLSCESVVDVQGICERDDRAPAGVEVHARKVSLISHAEMPPVEIFHPEAASKNRMETLLDHRAVSVRIPEVLDVFRVQAVVLEAFREFLRSKGFTEITTPKLVQAGAEGGSAVFSIEYFDQHGYLAQSPQFYKQIMVGSGLERVFEIGHAYRAEKSETNRHLTEYVSLDFEMGFVEGLHEIMDMHEALVNHIFRTVGQSYKDILRHRDISLPHAHSIPRISFPDAVRILGERFEKREGLQGDLDTEGERLISEWALQEYGSELVFVTGYHVDKRPLYTMPDAEKPPLTHSFDLLFRGVEITTGGQRIHEYKDLVESIEARGLDPTDYEGYLEAFKHGMPPHGGMGMGIERLTKQMLGLANIKEATLFPRDRYRLTP